ncbi:hypothetical protein SteCoe_20406 [Stentor coeruleus]|uniref:Uncharacterized protein n=1 Tax=Stentor coeruleus TaxID=5963 RepID=A0A1R2BS12_9CILI|nr:hypothetical protein SteCoe_20406 [Stentor coeruleus]
MERSSPVIRSESCIRENVERILSLSTITKRAQVANVFQARLYREQTSLRVVNDEDEFEAYPICSTTDENLGKHGIGLQLYLTFIKKCAWLFFFLSMMSIYPMYSNYIGKGFRSTFQNQRYTYFTLANQESINKNETSLDIGNDHVKICENNLNKLWIIDFFTSIGFLVFIYFYANSTNKTATQEEVNNIKISDFSLEVKGFPPYITDEQVISYFESYGHVVEVYKSRYYYGSLKEYKKLYETAYQIGIDRKIHKIPRIIKSKSASLSTFLKNTDVLKTHDELEVSKVFVIFSTIEEKKRALSEIRALTRSKSIFVRRNVSRRNFNFRLILKPAPDPSDILWENLEYGYLDLLKVRIPLFFLTILLVIVSFIVIYGVKAYYTTIPSSNSCQDVNVDGWMDLATAKITLKSNNEIICYCKQQKIDEIMSDIDLTNYCGVYLKRFTSTAFINFSVSMSIMAVNYLLKITVNVLSKYERFSRKTSKRLYVLTAMFTLMFVNTALSSLLANTHFSSSLGRFKGKYSDITREWYDDVGSTITVTMIMSMFSPHAFDLVFLYPYGIIKRAWCYKCFKSQHKLNKFFRGPSFDISDRFAQVLVVIFTTFMYSSGIPFLNMTCFCTLVLVYWCDKILILRHFRTPPVYSYDLNQRIITLMPLAVIIHAAFAIYAYGSAEIFPIGYEQEKEGSVIVPKKISFGERLSKPPGIANIIVILIGIFLMFDIKCHNKLFPKKNSARVTDEGAAVGNFNDLRESGYFAGLDSYNIFSNEKYGKLVHTMNSLVRRKREINMSSENLVKKVKTVEVPHNSSVESEENGYNIDSC